MENLRENNKLIAEFMGYNFITRNAFIARYPKDFIDNSDCYKCFHNSWDWLMPVIEKVENLNFAVEISESYCEIKDGSSIVIELGGGDYTKISATYKTLVDFIKWHNQQNQVSHFEFDENGDNVVK